MHIHNNHEEVLSPLTLTSQSNICRTCGDETLDIFIFCVIPGRVDEKYKFPEDAAYLSFFSNAVYNEEHVFHLEQPELRREMEGSEGGQPLSDGDSGAEGAGEESDVGEEGGGDDSVQESESGEEDGEGEIEDIDDDINFDARYHDAF